jgi:hypothetical protein
MNERGMRASELEWQNPLLPAIANDSPERDERTDHTAEIARRRDVEVCRTAIHIDDVIVVGISSGESMDKRGSISLGSSDNSRNQVQEIESDEHGSASARCGSFRSL